MKLHYRVYGQGKPLFILHGLFGSADNWNTLAKMYAKAFEVYVIDQRNHGLSPHNEQWSYQVMTEDLMEIVTERGLERVYIMGHSMGGKTAMFAACIYPNVFDKLIVADISPRHYPVHHDGILEALCELPLQQIQLRQEADAWLSGRIKEFGVRQFLLKSLHRLPDGGFGWRFNLPVIKKNIESVGVALPNTYQYPHPALFVKGEKSTYITLEDEWQIKQQFPFSTVNIISDAGHWLHAEQPDIFLAKTLSFLMNG